MDILEQTSQKIRLFRYNEMSINTSQTTKKVRLPPFLIYDSAIMAYYPSLHVLRPDNA